MNGEAVEVDGELLRQIWADYLWETAREVFDDAAIEAEEESKNETAGQ